MKCNHFFIKCCPSRDPSLRFERTKCSHLGLGFLSISTCTDWPWYVLLKCGIDINLKLMFCAIRSSFSCHKYEEFQQPLILLTALKMLTCFVLRAELFFRGLKCSLRCCSLIAVSYFNGLHAKEKIFPRCNHCDSVCHTGAHPA